MTPTTIWAAVLAVASAIVLLSNAAEKIVKAYQATKAPNARQDERLAALEAWQKEVDSKLRNDKDELDAIHEGLRASFQAQLALLDHGIDGNNLKQMQDAKEVLQRHLIARN